MVKVCIYKSPFQLCFESDWLLEGGFFSTETNTS